MNRKHSVRQRSPIHYGTLKLNVIGNPVSALSGHYWTDRGSLGQLYHSDSKNVFHEDFVSAAKIFQGSGQGSYCCVSLAACSSDTSPAGA